MTAPGDSVLIFVLLALLVAAGGYAAGRLHQRWQTSHDREQAYRDGYETGTSSVFSTAVRMLGPRRPVRASVPVRPTGTPAEADKTADKTADQAPDNPPDTTVGKTEPEPVMGFPLPAPPPPYAVTEPPAVGGVHYRPFTDPRYTEAPVLGEAEAHTEPRPRFADRSGLALGTTGHESDDQAKPAESPESAPQTETAAPSGRHTVPDELVQAPTYRLPPDRVFRARVKESSRLPEEPTTKLSVPKPRNS